MLKQLDILIGFVVVMSVISLLITILTQMVSSFLGLRGRNLSDALEAMVQQIDPQIDAKIREALLNRVLTQPIISDSMLSMSEKWLDRVPLLSGLRAAWKKASAIRPDELFAILTDIAGLTADKASGQLAAAQQAATDAKTASDIAAEQLKTVSKDKDGCAKAGQAKAAAQNAAIKVAAIKLLSALNRTSPAVTATVTAITARVPTLAVGTQAEATALIAQLSDAANVTLSNLERWFNSAQDRAQQWFAIHTRFWTVVASIVMAFVLQLDAFRLINQLSADSDLRSNLVSFSDTIRKQADQVFTNTASLAAINQTALKRLKEAALNAKEPEAAKIGEPPANLDTGAAAEDWLKRQLGAADPKINDFLKRFWELEQSISEQSFDNARTRFTEVTDAFSKTRFQLMPDPYAWPCEGHWSWPFQHLLGIVASAALLSLGAPFWFNTLKSLANLRPMLAKEIDKDPKQMPMKPL
jgi:hypothetical protein